MNKDHLELALEELHKCALIPFSETNGIGSENVRYGAVLTTGEFHPKQTVKYLSACYHWPKGTGNRHCYAWPCHGKLYLLEGASIIYSVFEYHYSLPKEIVAAYKDFVLKGPWKEFVKECDVITNEDGFLFPSLEKTPSNLLANFLIATRMAKEWPHHIKTWYDWTHNYNINPRIAFWYLTLFSDRHYWDNAPNSNSGNLHEFNQMNYYDWPIDAYSSNEKSLRNFLSGSYEALNPPFSKLSSYTPVNRIWGNNTIQNTYFNYYNYMLYSEYASSIGKMRSTKQESRLGVSIDKNSMFDWLLKYEDIIQLMKLEEVRLGVV